MFMHERFLIGSFPFVRDDTGQFLFDRAHGKALRVHDY
jgi:hypothetical protein